jgi:hypothetical protein
MGQSYGRRGYRFGAPGARLTSVSEIPQPVTDEDMQRMLAASASYSLVLLRTGPNYGSAEAQAIVWEHGRRNFELRAAGKLAIVTPVTDDTELAGVGIFTTDVDETRALMAADPAVAAGVLVPEVHPARSFPGDALPAMG